jgi:hypothetical protein
MEVGPAQACAVKVVVHDLSHKKKRKKNEKKTMFSERAYGPSLIAFTNLGSDP